MKATKRHQRCWRLNWVVLIDLITGFTSLPAHESTLRYDYVIAFESEVREIND